MRDRFEELVQVRMPKDLRRRICDAAAARQQSVSEFVRQAAMSEARRYQEAGR